MSNQAPTSISAINELPAYIEYEGYEIDPATGEHTPFPHRVPIVVRQTEEMAIQDLNTVWHLLDAAKLKVHGKNQKLTARSTELILDMLVDGDFYPYAQANTKLEYWDDMLEPGPMRAFAWPLLMQNAGYAEIVGDKLQLTSESRATQQVPLHEKIRTLWESWLETSEFDEFSRIDAIKGQQRASLTSPAYRRKLIAYALTSLTPNEWVSFDEFSQFIRTSNLRFNITQNLWDLYVIDPQYGSLGYSGYGEWPVVEGRYLLVFLFEYAATLGLIDIAYISPVDARGDFGNIWGMEDYRCLSQYDGLLYLRLNTLGAWCLGLTPSYSPPIAEANQVLEIRSNLEIAAIQPLLPSDLIFLERFALPKTDDTWYLDRQIALLGVEQGLQISEIESFLKERSNGAVPLEVTDWMCDLKNRSEVLKAAGDAVLLEVVDSALARQIVEDKRMNGLCMLAGEHTLVVPAIKAKVFRNVLHKLGYPFPSFNKV